MSDVAQGPGWWQASDGKWYPPQGTAPPPPAPPPPGGMSGCLKAALIVIAIVVVLGIAAVVLLAVGAKKVTDDVKSNRSAALKDVEVSACAPGQPAPAVQVRVTNHSSKTSNYLISVNLLDASGNKVGEASGAENDVASGQQATTDLAASSTSSEVASCTVGSVTRLASRP